VVVASLDAAYFETLYRSVALGAQGGVTLIGTDQVVRARVIGGQAQGIGTSTRVAGRVTCMQGPQGHDASTSTVDGIERLVSYQQVADDPLYVAVLVSRDEVLASWHTTRTLALSLTALLTLAVMAFAALVGLGIRRLEQSNVALQASGARAQASNQAKTEFLAAISHELRTPLTSIRGFAELVEFRLEDSHQREQAGMIRKAAEHLNQLLTEILDLVKVEASTDRLRLHVVDTGPGIASALHETIFERFRQGDGNVAHQHGGTGLGLALSRALAELLGGTLTVASAPGQGARFTLALPLA
jgi:signal transduction histidine kinase